MMEEIDKIINNSFEQSLIDNGYRWFTDNWKKSIRGFQKRITDHKGTKYFITGYHYNHNKQLNQSDLEDRDSYMFDCQFRIEKNGRDMCINVQFSADFIENKFRQTTTIQEVEDFYEKFFNDFNCDYYSKNEF